MLQEPQDHLVGPGDVMDGGQSSYMGAHSHGSGYHPMSHPPPSQQPQSHQPYGQPQQQPQQYGSYGSWNSHAGSGWPSGGPMNPGIPGVECTDADIIISTGLEHSRTREANLEYQRLLLANAVLFASLPTHYQSVHAQHIYHFLTHVRGRRFLQCIAPNVYVPFTNGPFQIAQEITGDPCKMAFQSRNPHWLLNGLGLFTSTTDLPREQTWVHRPNPRGNDWNAVSVEQVKDILHSEGPVHLLLLPKGINLKPCQEDSKSDCENVTIQDSQSNTNQDASRQNDHHHHDDDQDETDEQNLSHSTHERLSTHEEKLSGVDGTETGVTGDTIADRVDDTAIGEVGVGHEDHHHRHHSLEPSTETVDGISYDLKHHHQQQASDLDATGSRPLKRIRT